MGGDGADASIADAVVTEVEAAGGRAVGDHGSVAQLANLLFEAPGPTLGVARIAISKDPAALPEKDGAAIARRFRIALGLEQA